VSGEGWKVGCFIGEIGVNIPGLFRLKTGVLFFIFSPKNYFMFLQLAHTRLDTFQASKALTLECYRITREFPSDEKFAMVQQIRRAALSVHLNIAEGSSRKSIDERKRYYAIARGSVIEIDTAIDIAYNLNYKTLDELQKLVNEIIKTFKLLSGLIRD
jgi:four helix bundle protein